MAWTGTTRTRLGFRVHIQKERKLNSSPDPTDVLAAPTQPHYHNPLIVHLRTLTEANGSELWLADADALFVKLKCGTPSGFTARLPEQ